MTCFVRRSLVMVLLALAGCGGGTKSSGDAGQSDTGQMIDSRAPRTCSELRTCVMGCKTDQACATACVNAAPMAARAPYQEVVACTARECPAGNDEGCRCAAECYVPAPCVDLVDTCTEGGGDPYCEEVCH